MSDNDTRIGWDYVLTEDDTKGGEYESVILPDGDYDAVITRMERAQFNGSQNMAASPMAKLYMDIDGGELGVSRPIVNVILNQKLAWKIDTLAVACGFWKRGEGKGRRMPWEDLKGARLRVRVSTREYQGKKYQDVERFLAPKPANDGESPQTTGEPDGLALPDEV